MKHDLLKPILDLTLKESKRDNLLSSSCQEFFEHMRRVRHFSDLFLQRLMGFIQENIKELIDHCMTRHEALVRQLAETSLGGPRFNALIRRWEMNVEPPPADKQEAEAAVEK
jgi:protein phosphatase-4 regulatory subunit 3